VLNLRRVVEGVLDVDVQFVELERITVAGSVAGRRTLLAVRLLRVGSSKRVLSIVKRAFPISSPLRNLYFL
jgi:hypothetical protein